MTCIHQAKLKSFVLLPDSLGDLNVVTGMRETCDGAS